MADPPTQEPAAVGAGVRGRAASSPLAFRRRPPPRTLLPLAQGTLSFAGRRPNGREATGLRTRQSTAGIRFFGGPTLPSRRAAGLRMAEPPTLDLAALRAGVRGRAASSPLAFRRRPPPRTLLPLAQGTLSFAGRRPNGREATGLRTRQSTAGIRFFGGPTLPSRRAAGLRMAEPPTLDLAALRAGVRGRAASSPLAFRRGPPPPTLLPLAQGTQSFAGRRPIGREATGLRTRRSAAGIRIFGGPTLQARRAAGLRMAEPPTLDPTALRAGVPGRAASSPLASRRRPPPGTPLPRAQEAQWFAGRRPHCQGATGLRTRRSAAGVQFLVR